jgi:hypothetical protein
MKRSVKVRHPSTAYCSNLVYHYVVGAYPVVLPQTAPVPFRVVITRILCHPINKGAAACQPGARQVSSWINNSQQRRLLTASIKLVGWQALVARTASGEK